MAENIEELIDSSKENSSSDKNGVAVMEMLKQIIEKQNEQDKFNKEVIENQQKLLGEQQRVIEKLQSIQDEKSGRKRERVDNDDFIKRSAKRVDLDTSTIDKSGNGETVADESGTAARLLHLKSGKCFTLKHTFENVSKLNDFMHVQSDPQEHFGVCWRMLIYRNKEHLAFHTSCQNEKEKELWSIETSWEVKLVSKNGKPHIRKSCDTFKQDEIETIRYPYDWGWRKFQKWNVMEKEFLIDDSLTFEVTFEIENMTGIYKDNLRMFDDVDCSDMVLAVQDKKFHVLKLFLATHSSYFKAMFLGMFGESKKSEIPLTGIDADDFQNYLEVLYGDDAIDEYTVEGILMVSDMYDTQIVIKKCQQFLIEKSKKTLKKKLEMSVRYNLEELKKSVSLKSILPMTSDLSSLPIFVIWITRFWLIFLRNHLILTNFFIEF